MLNQAATAVRVLYGIQKNFCSNVSVYILSFGSKQSQYIYWLSTMIEDRTRNMLGKPCGKFLVSENADCAWVVVAREAGRVCALPNPSGDGQPLDSNSRDRSDPYTLCKSIKAHAELPVLILY